MIRQDGLSCTGKYKSVTYGWMKNRLTVGVHGLTYCYWRTMKIKKSYSIIIKPQLKEVNICVASGNYLHGGIGERQKR